MENNSKVYLCIDLKSFYASVECVERGLDPLTTNLVVADLGRTEKTICLAVTPALKAYGISGRARLYEVVQKVKQVNELRKTDAPMRKLTGESSSSVELEKDKSLALSYIVAPPRMAHYMKYSTDIYNIYLKYIAPEDIHVYSIDEVFMDITCYLKTYQKTPRELAMTIIQDVLKQTGITATAGIGTNLYLAKVALDIGAKKIKPDKNGVRIAELTEQSYKETLWSHTPITDFWRVGKGYAKRLEKIGLFTMGDIAKCSLGKDNDFYNEDKLFKIFGVNAELLIDHAWGHEPCLISDIKNYRPASSSLSSGQVLHTPYTFYKAELVLREMTEQLVLDLVEKGLVTDQMVLTVGYDIENLTNAEIEYKGEIVTDHYGRKIPKSAHGTANLEEKTSSTKQILEKVLELYHKITDKDLLIRRINLVANRIVDEREAEHENEFIQLDIFSDTEETKAQNEQKEIAMAKEKQIQKAMLDIRKRHGKNAILKATSLEEGATAIDRNKQIGGHKA